MTQKEKHIVDILVEERAPKLVDSGFWFLIRPIMNLLLGYNKAVKMVDHILPIGGHDALEYVSRLLNLQLEMKGFENLPASGPVIVIANHPTGIADGVALYDALKKTRSDIRFYANADALRVCPRFLETIIPVEWVVSKRTREKTRYTLTETQKTIADEMVLGIFPAGRLARVIKGELIDPEWAPSCVTIAKKYDVPILPVKIDGPNAFWFHTFDKFSEELRDITLFHELLNKKGKTFFLKAGELIDPKTLDSNTENAVNYLKNLIENEM